MERRGEELIGRGARRTTCDRKERAVGTERITVLRRKLSYCLRVFLRQPGVENRCWKGWAARELEPTRPSRPDARLGK